MQILVGIAATNSVLKIQVYPSFASNVLIFTYVTADILLYPKSLG